MTMDQIRPAPPTDSISHVFWPVGLTFMGLAFADQLAAAAAGGFDGLAVAPMTVKKALAEGRSLQELKSAAQDHGVRLTHADGVATWVKAWQSTTAGGIGAFLSPAFDLATEEAFDIIQGLGMSRVVAIGLFDEGSIPVSELVESFASFCDQAAARDLIVDLEFIPQMGIAELPLAVEILRSAARDNAGICVDTWHLQKGSSDYERDMALISTLPGHWLRTVQLVDADRQIAGDPLNPATVTRKFPGEGQLEITRILSLIAARGGLESVGPEIVGGRLSGLSIKQIGEVAGQTSRDAIQRLRHG